MPDPIPFPKAAARPPERDIPRAPASSRRQPCADELIHAVNRFPDLFAAFVTPEPTWWQELVEDWHDLTSEVRRSPVSHALVAVFTVIAWTALLLAPIVIGSWS
jgi:hypothetical protein